MALVTSGQLVPAQVVERLLALTPQQLERQPLGPLLLLVKIPADEHAGRFVEQLSTPSSLGPSSRSESTLTLPTADFPALGAQTPPAMEVDVVELIAELGSAPHGILPLLPQRGLEELSIGRAASADLRLEHPSVSAQHACISLGESSVQIRDLGSKNGTRLNEVPLKAGKKRWVQPMDRLAFGRIETFACDPRALRAVLLQDLRSMGRERQ